MLNLSFPSFNGGAHAHHALSHDL